MGEAAAVAGLACPACSRSSTAYAALARPVKDRCAEDAAVIHVGLSFRLMLRERPPGFVAVPPWGRVSPKHGKTGDSPPAWIKSVALFSTFFLENRVKSGSQMTRASFLDRWRAS